MGPGEASVDTKRGLQSHTRKRSRLHTLYSLDTEIKPDTSSAQAVPRKPFGELHEGSSTDLFQPFNESRTSCSTEGRRTARCRVIATETQSIRFPRLYRVADGVEQTALPQQAKQGKATHLFQGQQWKSTRHRTRCCSILEIHCPYDRTVLETAVLHHQYSCPCPCCS